MEIPVEISLVSLDHLDENVLEEYVFGRLSNAKSAVVEEHLLICPHCQTSLAETDEYIRLMKYAAARQPDARPILIPRPTPVPPPAPAAKLVQPIAVRQPQTWYRPMQVATGILAACAAVFILTQG